MLLGVIFTHVSVLLAYLAAWILIVFEFVRIDFFIKRYMKVLGAITFALLITAVLFGIWKITPKTKELPTLDQQMDAISQKFPWLRSGPKIEISSAPSPAPQIVAVHEASLRLNIYHPQSPALAVENTSDRVVENVRWALIMFRERDQAYFSFYPVPDQTIPYIKAHSWGPPDSMDLENIPTKVLGGDKQMRDGDVFTGTLALDCAECAGSTYIVHFVWGHSGWFYRIKDSKGGLMLPVDASKSGISKWIPGLEAKAKSEDRVDIKQEPVLRISEP